MQLNDVIRQIGRLSVLRYVTFGCVIMQAVSALMQQDPDSIPATLTLATCFLYRLTSKSINQA